jgi:hypothetical protein
LGRYPKEKYPCIANGVPFEKKNYKKILFCIISGIQVYFCKLQIHICVPNLVFFYQLWSSCVWETENVRSGEGCRLM